MQTLRRLIGRSTQRNIYISYYDAIEKGDIKRVKQFFDSKQLRPSHYYSGMFALAARKGHIDILKLLLNSIKENTHEYEYDLAEGLRHAVSNGYIDIVRLLLEVPTINPQLSFKSTVYEAIKGKHFDIVKLLLADDRVDPFTHSHFPSTLRLAMQTNTEIFKLLINHPKIHENYHSILGDAVKSDDIELLKILLNDPNMDSRMLTNVFIENVMQQSNNEIFTLFTNNPKIDLSKMDTFLLVSEISVNNIDGVILLLKNPKLDPFADNDRIINSLIQTRNIEILKLLVYYKPVEGRQGLNTKKLLETAKTLKISKFVEFLEFFIEISDSGSKWKGVLQSDMDEIQRLLIEKPSDISMCPVCAEVVYREDGCMYMNHTCKDPNKKLKSIFKDHEGKIEWCTLCGRVTHHHRHYVNTLPTITSLPDFAEVQPSTTGEVRVFDKDCVKSGGGGIEEKMKRFDRFFETTCELQKKAGKITKAEYTEKIVEAMWSAPLDSKANSKGIINNKKFTPHCSFPEKPSSVNTTNNNNNNYPDIKRPADESDLMPITLLSPDNYCAANLEPHDDGRPTFQFRHKQADGSINDHGEDTYCAEDLIELMRAKTITGKCFIGNDCNALLYPEELKGIVDDKTYDIYHKIFNKRMAEKTGGFRKKRSKKRKTMKKRITQSKKQRKTRHRR